MIWPVCGSVSRSRELQAMVLPPLFSYARTDSAVRWRMPWPFVEIETGRKRDRVSVFPFYERTRNYGFSDRERTGSVTRFGWRLVELYDDETRVFPFWTSGEDYFRIWPFWESEKKDGVSESRMLALFPIRWVPAVDRNWAKFWTFYERRANPGYTDHSLLWGLIRWRSR